MPATKKYDTSSKVEQFYVERSGYDLVYRPVEKIPCVVVPNFPEMGKLTALRFIEWVQKNPGGVISLPTGKTPEFFIKWMGHYLRGWSTAGVKKELESCGIDPKNRPSLESLRFVQIDEFYPINPAQQNSFNYYIHKFYIRQLGLDPAKAMLIDTTRIGIEKGRDITDIFPGQIVDLSLRTRPPRSHLEVLQQKAIVAVDNFCSDYEDLIREKGGIGFFLGGIGPDGHIAFNVRWSDHHSTTRLTGINYETAASASTDLGGLEIAEKRLVITLGLATITAREDVTAIIMAAGEAKAQIVGDAVQKPRSIDNPASILQNRPNSRFYLTRGAACRLHERNFADLSRRKEIPETEVLRHIIDLSCSKGRQLSDLTESDMRSDRSCSLILDRTGKPASELASSAAATLTQRIAKSRQKITNTRYLHTGPHHDDIMLGYLGYLNHLLRESTNSHKFVVMTSGFTSVTNLHLLKLLEELETNIAARQFQELIKEGYFDSAETQDLETSLYLEGMADRNEFIKSVAQSRRLLRILFKTLEENDVKNLQNRMAELKNYLQTQYPGKKDIQDVQKIKGCIREWEEDLIWGYFGFGSTDVIHGRLGFYTGDIFTKEPDVANDVMPVLKIIRKTNPDVVSVALDPEGSGPDTHYKVMQAIAEALKIWEKESGRSDIRVLGYRNVWYTFHPAEANIYVPVSLRSMTILNDAFMNCYSSQKAASFPSHAYQGPFSELAQKIHFEQFTRLRTLLGEDFFHSSQDMLIRASKGFMFIRELGLKEFYSLSEELKRSVENV